MNTHHNELLSLIQKNSGKGTKHTALDNYLGNSHPRFPIDNPTMRKIASGWMRSHKDMSAKEFATVLASLVKGKSANEKQMVGFLMDYATKEQKKFDPMLFDEWLDHLIGWAEVDTVVTGKYSKTEIAGNVPVWKKLLTSLSKSPNINKRRASIAFLVPVLTRTTDVRLAELTLANVERLKGEKEVIITKAISWVLRAMIKNFRTELENYLEEMKRRCLR